MMARPQRNQGFDRTLYKGDGGFGAGNTSNDVNSKEVCVAAVGTYVGGCMTLSKVDGKMMFYLKYNTDKTSPKSWKARFLE